MNRPSNSRRGQIALILGFLFCALAGAQSNYVKETYRHIFLSLIDSTPIGQTTPAAVNTTALTVNSAAPSDHTLIGNGSVYADVTPITGTLTVAAQSPIAGSSCVTYSVTMSASVPAGAVVGISVAQGYTISGNGMIDPYVYSVSGSTVQVDFCNNWDTPQGWNAAIYNLRVDQ